MVVEGRGRDRAFVQYHVSHTAIPKGMGPREALARHMHLLVDEYGGSSGRIVAQILAEGQGDPDVLRAFGERFWYGGRAVVRELVEEARRKGEFRSDMETELQMDAPIYLRLIMRHMPLDRKFADAHVAAMMRRRRGVHRHPPSSDRTQTRIRRTRDLRGSLQASRRSDRREIDPVVTGDYDEHHIYCYDSHHGQAAQPQGTQP